MWDGEGREGIDPRKGARRRWPPRAGICLHLVIPSPNKGLPAPALSVPLSVAAFRSSEPDHAIDSFRPTLAALNTVNRKLGNSKPYTVHPNCPKARL